MTDKVYLQEMYLKEFEAKITSVDGNKVVLDRTAFYPVGGGEPGDTGKLVANGKEFLVTDLKKNGDDIIHILNSAEGISVGDEVNGVIDWDKRYAYMKYHTSIHIIDGILTSKHAAEGFSTGSQIYADRARIDFDMDTLTRDMALELVSDTNKLIAEGRKIIVKTVTQEEALKMPNLVRTEPGKELIKRLNFVRIVEIEGLDMQMDGGLHVADAKEIGKLQLSDYVNKGSHSKRLEVKIVQ